MQPREIRVFDEVSAELLEAEDVAVKKMFGHRCLMVGRKGFAIDFKDELVLKLPDQLRAQVLKLDGAHLFDPMGGRPMKEWVQIPADHEGQWVVLAREALNYVRT